GIRFFHVTGVQTCALPIYGFAGGGGGAFFAVAGGGGAVGGLWILDFGLGMGEEAGVRRWEVWGFWNSTIRLDEFFFIGGRGFIKIGREPRREGSIQLRDSG